MENYHGDNEKIVETEEDVMIDDLDTGSEAQEDSVGFQRFGLVMFEISEDSNCADAFNVEDDEGDFGAFKVDVLWVFSLIL